MYVAHLREVDGKRETQRITEHLYGTQKLCKKFGDEFNNGDFAAECGLLHDIGKYSKEFQHRILEEGKKCDHATAGAKIAFKKSPYSKLAAYCIAGHHSGLPDAGSPVDTGGEGTLYGRISDENKLPDSSAFATEIDVSDIKLIPKSLRPTVDYGGFTFAFFTHMIYSCLTDSDYLDTEQFMLGNKGRVTLGCDFDIIKRRLDAKLNEFKEASGEVNRKRAEILNSCINMGESKRGLYSLTVPTGGGKTLSSMAFALNHIKTNGLRRIIYVIPYTSIIEQNARVFSDVLGRENILEHHSNYDYAHSDNFLDKSLDELKYLATENWDMPIIITTNVQFFESLFSNKSSKNRKLHNIANSIIIFDEAQMLPVEYLQPCVAAISELVVNYRCTAVLCSATQPALEQFFPKDLKPIEICKNTSELYRVFTRTEIENIGEVDTDTIAALMMEKKQCLTIVNTRKHAKKIFELLKGEGNYHLSTLMCPVNRNKVIQEIRKRLENKQPCRVVSTRLIEAGVDVDFPVVYRSLCGLDSIIQSAGRCNREGKLKDESGNKIKGMVYVFKAEEEFYKSMPPSMVLPINITEEIIRTYQDITSPGAIKAYFNELYHCKGAEGLDVKKIMKSLNGGIPKGRLDDRRKFNYDFKQISEKFKLMKDNTYSVIIPYDDNAKYLISKLDYVDKLKGTLRSLQQYTVNIYSNEFEALNGAGKLKMAAEDMAVLRSSDDYNDMLGLNIDIKSGMGVFF